MELYLIRHGKTKGNLEHRYVGTTDEPLLMESVSRLKKMRNLLDPVDRVYTSGRLRCRQSAGILFPACPAQVWKGLEEMDFGAYEYKNYEELKENSAYQKWVAGGGALPFPAGEGEDAFRRRTRQAFLECLQDAADANAERAAFVVHGGTIMSIMEAYAQERRSFYDWQIPNGGIFFAVWDPAGAAVLRSIREIRES